MQLPPKNPLLALQGDPQPQLPEVKLPIVVASKNKFSYDVLYAGAHVYVSGKNP